MKKIYFLGFLLISALLIRCSGNPEAEGDTSFANGKYTQALSYYMEVKKNNSNNPRLDEKIALSYLHKGQDLYKRRHNLQAFSGNFEKGQDFIPEETSESFNKSYSVLLEQFAQAYYQAKPANEIQKEQYFSKTLELLDLAITFDPDNAQAEKTLQEIKNNNFEQTYEKGKHFYSQAKKEKNPDLYITAEHYLERAVDFAPENTKAQKLLRSVRKKTIAILDMDSDFPIAIPDKKYANGYWMLAFTAMNNSGASLTFDPEKLIVMGANDHAYSFEAEYTAKFDDGLAKAVTLAQRKQIDGTLAFKMKKSVKIRLLKYQLDKNHAVKKYFY